MKTLLEMKLNQTIPYTNAELNWLLEHLGDPDPAVRDDLVYASFCQGLMAERFSRTQVEQLLQVVQLNQLQTKGLGSSDETTLTRSFTSLLNVLLLYVDGDEQHSYCGWMSEHQRLVLFDLALTYLAKEDDTRGYQSDVGWIHAIAHGADFLQAVACHPAFPAERLSEVLAVLGDVFQRLDVTFVAGESHRLAEVVVQLVLSERLTQEELAAWLSEMMVTGETPADYAKQLNLQAFLSAIYFRLEKEDALQVVLRSAILQHPHLTLV